MDNKTDTNAYITELADNMEIQLSKMRIESCSGGNFVKGIINGSHDIIDIQVEDSPFIKDDIPMLLDLIKIAFNQAKQEAVNEAYEIFINKLGD
jgi:DNA-binding protein YbaB